MCSAGALPASHGLHLIHKSPCPDVHSHTQAKERKEQGRSSLAHKRQRNARYREEPDHHSRVDGYLEKQHRRQPGQQKRSGTVRRHLRPVQQAEQHRKKWSKGRVEDWTGQSHHLAQEITYGKLPKPGADGVIVLDAAYEQEADGVVAGQIEKAGVRLAAVLNACLR